MKGPIPPMAFSRVLIANRGEIAVRVIRACRALGIPTVVAVSEADRNSLAARLADWAMCIGPAPSAASYLNPGRLITAAQGTGAQAIHPGYGFWSEQPGLADACQECGIKFIGPSSRVLRDMGNKLLARQMASPMGIPTIPGSPKVANAQEAMDLSRQNRIRQEICQAAVTSARNIGYESTDTVEFVLDQDSGNFYFLEMSTRWRENTLRAPKESLS